MKKGEQHPYKGIPRTEWPQLTAARRAVREAEAQAIADIPTLTDQVAVPVNRDPVSLDAHATADHTIPPNLFSGENKQLEVMGRNGSVTDPIPGFYLYWFNDDGGTGIRIMKAKRSGYEFVQRDEVLLNDGLVDGSDAAGDHVRKVVGSIGNQPLYAYLMKKPTWIKEAHDLEMRKVNDAVMEQIRRGRVPKTDADARQFARQDLPQQSNLPPIETNTKLYR